MHVFVSICPYEIFAGNVIEGMHATEPRNLLSFFFFFYLVQNLFCLYETQQQITPKVEEEIQNLNSQSTQINLCLPSERDY